MEFEELPLKLYDGKIGEQFIGYNNPETYVQIMCSGNENNGCRTYTDDDIMEFIRHIHGEIYENIDEIYYQVYAYEDLFMVMPTIYFVNDDCGRSIFDLIDDQFRSIECENDRNGNTIIVKRFIYKGVMFYVSDVEPNITSPACYVVHPTDYSNNERLSKYDEFRCKMFDMNYVFKNDNKYEVMFSDKYVE